MNAVLIVARALHFCALISLVGSFAFLVLVADPAWATIPGRALTQADVLRKRLVLLARYSLAVALLSALLWLLLEAVAMSGQPLIGALSGPDLVTTVLSRTRFGRNWNLRLVLLLVVLVLTVMRAGANQRRATVWRGVVLLFGSAALATVAGAGHAADMRGGEGEVHLIADGLHLVAAGVWIGALIPLASLLNALRTVEAHFARHVAYASLLRFSMLGLVSVGTLIVTGSVNTWFLVGSVHALVGAPYGRLLLVKLALFSAMVAVAFVNRAILTPRVLENAGANDALGQLRHNAAIEVVLGVFIVLIVGTMGITPPAMQALSMMR